MDLPVRLITDDNALQHALTGLPATAGELVQKVFAALRRVKRIDFVTDHSIKSGEQLRRGSSEPYIMIGSSTKLFRDWKSILSDNYSQESLMKLILKEWLRNREVLFVNKGTNVVLTSSNGKLQNTNLYQS